MIEIGLFGPNCPDIGFNCPSSRGVTDARVDHVRMVQRRNDTLSVIFPMKTQSLKLTLGALGFALLLNPASASVVSLPLAQIPTELKTGFQYGLGILFMVGFIWGVINIWGGAEKMKRGDAEGKMGIVSGIIIAGAAAIMSALFYIFGLSDGALAPQF